MKLTHERLDAIREAERQARREARQALKPYRDRARQIAERMLHMEKAGTTHNKHKVARVRASRSRCSFLRNEIVEIEGNYYTFDAYDHLLYETYYRISFPLAYLFDEDWHQKYLLRALGAKEPWAERYTREIECLLPD